MILMPTHPTALQREDVLHYALHGLHGPAALFAQTPLASLTPHRRHLSMGAIQRCLNGSCKDCSGKFPPFSSREGWASYSLATLTGEKAPRNGRALLRVNTGYANGGTTHAGQRTSYGSHHVPDELPSDLMRHAGGGRGWASREDQRRPQQP